MLDADWLFGRWPTGWLAGMPKKNLASWLAGWLARRFSNLSQPVATCRNLSQPVAPVWGALKKPFKLAGWLAGWLGGWVAGWLAGWLAGQQVIIVVS